MDEKTFRYAEELMDFQQVNNKSRDTLERKILRLSEQFMLTRMRCMPYNYCASVTTQKTGIVGKLIVLMKRMIRKATFFIVRDLTYGIASFEHEMVNLVGSIIEMQEDIVVEMIELRNSTVGNIIRDDSSQG